MDWKEAKKQSKSFVPYIEEYDADLVEEMKGVADGAEKDFEDIVALNARSEIFFNGKNMDKEKVLDGCTSFAATPEATKYGNTLIGQNWDWRGALKKSLIVLSIKQKDKPDIFMITEAGIIGKIGFNSAGLGVCLNALASQNEPIGTPLHILLRGVLNSETLNDAILAAGNAKIACAANFMMAHKEGEALDIEVWPGDFDVLYPTEGFLVHTNHFTSPRNTHLKDTGKLVFPDTFMRYGRMTNFLRKNKGEIDLNLMKKLYTDHVGFPDGICRHADVKDDPGLQMETVFSILMDLERKEMYIAPGSPCSHKYELYKF
jgi:isopenicillin-N N-acyltransferase-like protein